MRVLSKSLPANKKQLICSKICPTSPGPVFFPNLLWSQPMSSFFFCIALPCVRAHRHHTTEAHPYPFSNNRTHLQESWLASPVQREKMGNCCIGKHNDLPAKMVARNSNEIDLSKRHIGERAFLKPSYCLTSHNNVQRTSICDLFR